MRPKIVFMGTPDFSATVLKALHSEFPVAAAISAPDRPAGRGHKLTPTPLKVAAEELVIPVYQFEKVSRDGIYKLNEISPDIIITAAFGQILSEEVLSLPPLGVLNVHASLLPLYRGASPIQWTLLNGDKETGVTIMRTVREVDAGDILLQKKLTIGEKETAGELFERLAVLGGEAAREAVRLVAEGRAVYTPQDSAKASRCGMIRKEFGKMDFTRDARYLYNFVRAMTPWPSAYTFSEGKRIKILETEIVNKFGAESGTVVAADKIQGLVAACGDGALRLKTIRPEGKPPMSDCEYLLGHQIKVGSVLG